jgi:hypothetical protein
MGNVIDLQSADRPEIFDRAGTDGLFGRTRRLRQPLGQYLRAAETPRYLASNDRSGVVAARGDNESGVPADDYRAFLLATTVRVLFVVGDDSGDRTISLPHEDIVAVHCTSGIRTSTLEIVTVDEDRWAFECKGDLGPVRAFVDEATQIWARTLTELERAESRVEAATGALAATDLDTAATQITAAQEALDGSRERVEALGATAAIDERLQAVQTRIDTCQRRRHVSAAEEHRDTARYAWENRAYERAANAYEQATVEYDRALAVTAPEPSTEAVTDARDAVDEEYTELLSAPVDAAQVAASAARATTDPAARATHWEDALDRYRAAYELDWGRDRRFDGDRGSLRQALADIAVELVDAHREAGRQERREASGESKREASVAACEDATAHFERAREVATELVPDRREPSADELITVSERGASVGSEPSGR